MRAVPSCCGFGALAQPLGVKPLQRPGSVASPARCHHTSLLGTHRAAIVKAVLPVRFKAAQYSPVCNNEKWEASLWGPKAEVWLNL